MKSIKTKLIAYLEALRFPWLLIITVVLFAINVFVPDVFPFIDEILLALIAVMQPTWGFDLRRVDAERLENCAKRRTRVFEIARRGLELPVSGQHVAHVRETGERNVGAGPVHPAHLLESQRCLLVPVKHVPESNLKIL